MVKFKFGQCQKILHIQRISKSPSLLNLELWIKSYEHSNFQGLFCKTAKYFLFLNNSGKETDYVSHSATDSRAGLGAAHTANNNSTRR